MGYELLIRPRDGEAPLSEGALRAWLDRALRERVACASLSQAPDRAVLVQAPEELPPSPPSASEAAPPGRTAPLQEPASAARAPDKDEQRPAGTLASPMPPRASSDSWTLPNGGGALRARIHRGEAGHFGADLEVPFGGAEEELRSAVDFALLGATELGATVFDPQLLRVVSRESAEDVVERWRLSQQWAVDVAGSAEDARSTMALTPAPPLLQRRHKIALGIVGLLVLLYEALGLIMDAAVH